MGWEELFDIHDLTESNPGEILSCGWMHRQHGGVAADRDIGHLPGSKVIAIQYADRVAHQAHALNGSLDSEKLTDAGRHLLCLF